MELSIAQRIYSSTAMGCSQWATTHHTVLSITTAVPAAVAGVEDLAVWWLQQDPQHHYHQQPDLWR